MTKVPLSEQSLLPYSNNFPQIREGNSGIPKTLELGFNSSLHQFGIQIDSSKIDFVYIFHIESISPCSVSVASKGFIAHFAFKPMVFTFPWISLHCPPILPFNKKKTSGVCIFNSNSIFFISISEIEWKKRDLLFFPKIIGIKVMNMSTNWGF